jgi:anti-anti-sigma factor
MTDHPVRLTAEISEIWQGDRVSVLRVAGEIDVATAEVFGNAFESVTEHNDVYVIIDTTDVTFMDSTGLHGLIEGKRLLHEHGRTIVLITSPQVRRVLELIFPEPLFAARVNTMEEALIVLADAAATSRELPTGRTAPDEASAPDPLPS